MKKRIILFPVLLICFLLASVPAPVSAMKVDFPVPLAKKKKTIYYKGLVVGDRISLKVTKGKKKMKASDLKFKSSKRSIATVSKKGLIRIKKPGRVTITVTTKNKKRKTLIRISSAKKPKPRLTDSSEGGFYLNRNSVMLANVRAENFQFHVYGPDGKEIPSEKIIRWRSKITSNASISQNGTVYAKGLGETNIQVLIHSGVRLSAHVSVY